MRHRPDPSRPEKSALSQLEPAHRPSASPPPAPPRGQPRHQPKPAAAFRVTADRSQLRPRLAAIGNLSALAARAAHAGPCSPRGTLDQAQLVTREARKEAVPDPPGSGISFEPGGQLPETVHLQPPQGSAGWRTGAMAEEATAVHSFTLSELRVQDCDRPDSRLGV
jgi:hypothetical protein